nr:MAG TPA: hypothetical protein [Crassvirales sp.]
MIQMETKLGITETRVYGRHGKATDFGSTEFP